MCGIAGIFGALTDANREALRRMAGAIAHRGPDGHGFWEGAPDARGFGPLFAHRRLSILDLSPAGAQPMLDEATGDAVTYNGEIYNYVALREALAARGHRLRSTGDSAVMLRALSLDGPDATSTFRGMFAFAHWNVRLRQLTLARDALGIKPLYLARNAAADGAWTIAFASELRALLASGLLPTARLDPATAATVVWNGFTVAPATAVVGIESMQPGELRVLDASGREQRRARHWSLPAPGSEPPVGVEEFGAALQESVRLHLASDVPLGVFLSGGVDSSAVANLASRTAAGRVHTFTLAFEEAERNEGEFARRIAAAIGTEHREVLLRQQDFLGGLDRAIDSLDQPTFDGLNSYFMSRAVRDAGFVVALVGSGGDELFGGYTSFRDLPRLLRAGRWLRWLPSALVGSCARAFARRKAPSGPTFPAQTRWAKLPDMLSHADDLLALYQLAYGLFVPGTQSTLLATPPATRSPLGLPAATVDQLRAEIRGRSPLAATSVLEQRLFLGERLLRDTDAASMAPSIEIRLPFVDQHLVALATRLPDRVRYEPIRRKALLRQLGLVGLSPALFDRPKSGFELPYDRWLRSSLGSRIDEAFHDTAAVRNAGLKPTAVLRLWEAFRAGSPGLYWSRVWALYVLVRWCQAHRVSV